MRRMRRVVRVLPLEIRAWAVAIFAVALCSIAALTLLKRSGPSSNQPEAPSAELAPQQAPRTSTPKEPGQRVNREKKAAREARRAGEPTSRTTLDKAAPKPGETGEEEGFAETGRASWYNLASSTASGEAMEDDGLTAAHRSLPIGTMVLVENLDNGRSVVVRINDRGPAVKTRIIDLSKAAAKMLGMLEDGVVTVRVSRVKEIVAGDKASAAGAAGAQALPPVAEASLQRGADFGLRAG
jgi:rare lipoprotein A